MWSLKSIHQIGAGACDKPFERLMVLGECSRTIFHSTCTGDVEMALCSISSLVGKPLGVVQNLDIEDVAVADSVPIGLGLGSCGSREHPTIGTGVLHVGLQ